VGPTSKGGEWGEEGKEGKGKREEGKGSGRGRKGGDAPRTPNANSWIRTVYPRKVDVFARWGCHGECTLTEPAVHAWDDQ